ncbi:serine/threonine-protein kinase [Lentzea sp. BCCO 10_0798]|uniref:non-specific serine/threonine protein kinase n=1 Tax=Lentzea kristufekii TaxID=3095430 RepID=A0ABU4U0Q8_9PSEU|nr:serine/threonine-protein kinase [Lentzea sp. BCCO 10_0798]MDX8054159.1 serine/threonine-protein kinase [Lentzea sp. BCCO 10_0798]
MSAPWDGDLTGAVIDNRFVVGTLLGSGGMAEVYRAYDRSTTSSVAIKIFSGPGLPDDELRLQREASMLVSLDCPGIIPVYASGTVSRRPYFVMREITGGTLRQRMREPLPPRFVARIGSQIAAVLDHVHDLGVVHRDIKPSNILLDDTEKQAYLADFGLALVAEVTRVTTSGVLVGTAGYLSPEQVRGAEVGPPADVYSLGLVLLECLTGRTEYPGGDAEAALARLARSPRIPVDLPLAWVSLLSAMTDMDPARRPSAAQCSRSLQAAFEASRGLPALLPDAAVAPDEPPAVPEPRSRRGKRVAIAAAAVAVTAVAVVVANFGGGGNEAPAADRPVVPDAHTQVVTVTPSTVTVVQTPDGSGVPGVSDAPGVPGAPQPGAGGVVSSSTPVVETTGDEPAGETSRPSKEKRDRGKPSSNPAPSAVPQP